MGSEGGAVGEGAEGGETVRGKAVVVVEERAVGGEAVVVVGRAGGGGAGQRRVLPPWLLCLVGAVGLAVAWIW